VEFNRHAVSEILDRAKDIWIDKKAPGGVAVEEAWKCRHCSFADGCKWREEKAREFTVGKGKEIVEVKEGEMDLEW
jgi:hypothetical protein